VPIRCSASERQPNGTTRRSARHLNPYGGGPNLFDQGPRRNVTCHVESASSSSRGSAPSIDHCAYFGRHAAGERSGCIDKHGVVALFAMDSRKAPSQMGGAKGTRTPDPHTARTRQQFCMGRLAGADHCCGRRSACNCRHGCRQKVSSLEVVVRRSLWSTNHPPSQSLAVFGWCG
jgi:hypothetical protein